MGSLSPTYHNVEGTVLDIHRKRGITPAYDRYQFAIELGEPYACTVTTREMIANDLFPTLERRSHVHCSWMGGLPDAPGFFLDPRGIEAAGAWDRPSYYRPIPESIGEPNGHHADRMFTELIARSGIRADDSTAFEDEAMGIDLWVFMRFRRTGEWQWQPIDLTLRNLKDRRIGSKFARAFSKRVIPFRVSPVLHCAPETALERLIAHVEEFYAEHPDFQPMTRDKARRRERKFNGTNKKKQRNMKTIIARATTR